MKQENKTKTQLRDDADDAFSLYIRERDNYQCLFGMVLNEQCTGVHQCCHIIAKGSCSELRYDPNNAVDGCYLHHMFGWHSEDPIKSKPFLDCFINTYPKRWEYINRVYAEYKLKVGTSAGFKPTRDYYIDIINTYKNKLKELKDARHSF
jgi:hypothetical protein